MITDTLEGRIKLAFANGVADDEIAQQEGVPIKTVLDILADCRLPIKVTGTIKEVPTNAVHPYTLVNFMDDLRAWKNYETEEFTQSGTNKHA